MLPRAPLAVILRRHDKATTPGLDAFHKRRIDIAKQILGNRRDIGTQGQNLRTSRQDVVCGNIVTKFEQDLASQRLFEIGTRWQRLDIGATPNLNRLWLSGGWENPTVINQVRVRQTNVRSRKFAWVSDFSCQRRRRTGSRTGEIDTV